jgi:hypothetical protein
MSQLLHDEPELPHSLAVAVMHWLVASQHAPDDGQLVASHTQPLAVQRWPVAHAGPPLQVQPLALQPSEIEGSHALQNSAPPTGHCETVGGLMHELVPESQQPPTHEAAVHTHA